MTIEEFLAKFNKALVLRLDYFSGDKQNKNLSQDVFLKIIKSLTADNMSVKFNTRTASIGLNSTTGEKETFHINFEVYITFRRLKVRYYCHGYFFDENDLKGVFIHSFREN